MDTAQTPARLLRALLDSNGARPFVTFYDDASGERVELSVATFDNWVAKTANLLQDGLALEPGARVSLLLPLHWQTQVWLVACWSAGLIAAPDGDPADADLVVAGPETLQAARACPGDRIALSLRPLAGRFPEPPEGFLDYAAEVPTYGDRFTPYQPPGPGSPALELDGRVLSAGELIGAARETAVEMGISEDGRVLCVQPPSSWTGLAAGLLIPLAMGASTVLCRNLDPSALERRIAQEHVTVVWGT